MFPLNDEVYWLVMYVMRFRPTDCLWMGSAFGAALIVATIVIMVFGAGERGTATALRVSARFSFLLFWIAYAGSPLTALFGATFQPLKKRAREFGLAFAAALLVHIGLVGWLCWIGAPPGFGGVCLLRDCCPIYLPSGTLFDRKSAAGARPQVVVAVADARDELHCLCVFH